MWLKTTEIYSLAVLEVSGLKSRGQQGRALSRGCTEIHSLPLCWLLAFPGLWPHMPISASIFTWPSPLLHVFSVYLVIQNDLILRSLAKLYLHRSLFQTKVHSQFPGCGRIFLGAIIQTTTPHMMPNSGLNTDLTVYH